jgi:hypothetical protein
MPTGCIEAVNRQNADKTKTKKKNKSQKYNVPQNTAQKTKH